MPCQSADRMKGKGLRPKGAAGADRVTSPTIKSGRINNGLGIPLALSFGRQSKRHNMKPCRQGWKERMEPNHRGRASVPTYTAMDADGSPTSPRASTATCSRELIDDSQRFARARSRRSVPVSPTTGNGNSCGAGPLPDTTSCYLVGFATRISTRYGYRPLTSNSAQTDRAHRNVRAIRAYHRHSGGRLRGTNRHSGHLSVGTTRA